MEFRISEVATRTFGAISRNFGVFFALSATLAGVPAFLIGLADLETGAFAAAGILGGLISFVSAYILQGALIHGAVVDFNGGRAKFGDCLSTGLKHFLPLLAIAILMALGVWAGMILLLVPGIILSIMWIVAVPARVVENTGILESFGRSRELTKGSRWGIFGLAVIYVIVYVLISVIVMVPTGIFADGLVGSSMGAGGFVIGILNALVTVTVTMVGAAGVSAIYFELRKSKEGIGADALAAAFD